MPGTARNSRKSKQTEGVTREKTVKQIIEEQKERTARIAHLLDTMAFGVAYRCPGCAEILDNPDEWAELDDSRCPFCGYEFTGEESIMWAELADFFEGNLWWLEVTRKNGVIVGAKFALACSSPETWIEIDGEDGAVIAYLRDREVGEILHPRTCEELLKFADGLTPDKVEER